MTSAELAQRRRDVKACRSTRTAEGVCPAELFLPESRPLNDGHNLFEDRVGCTKALAEEFAIPVIRVADLPLAQEGPELGVVPDESGVTCPTCPAWDSTPRSTVTVASIQLLVDSG